MNQSPSAAENVLTKSRSPVYWQSIFFSLLINVLSLALPIAMLQVYDRILANQSTGTAALLITGVTIAILLEGLLRFGRGFLAALYSEHFDHRAPVELMGRLVTSDISTAEEYGHGKLMQYFHDLSTLRQHLSGQSVQVLCDLPFSLLFLAAIGYIGGRLVVIPGTLLLVAAGLGVAFGFLMSRPTTEHEREVARRDRFLLRCLNSLANIKANSLETLLSSRFDDMTERVATSNLTTDRVSAAVQNSILVLSQLGTVGIIVYGSYLVIAGELTTGMLAACTILTGRSIAPIGGLVNYWTRYQKVLETRKHLREVTSLPVDTVFSNSVTAPSATMETGDIEIENLSLQLPWGKIESIDLHISHGEIVVFEGSRRSGKSNLLSLVAGMYAPDSGTLLVGGKPHRAYSRERFLEGLAIVPRRAAAFKGTVLENLTMFRSEFNPAALRYSRELGLNDFIVGLAKGYNTPMSWSVEGPTSEPGLIQRIGIVRAIAREPKILVLDDADVPIDLDGQKRLAQCLRGLRGKTTVLLVTQRQTIRAIADRIVVMEQGQIAAIHSETPQQLQEAAS